ncbi:MAG: TMEM175 family protein [Vulcanimicrobiaceae bacterium]
MESDRLEAFSDGVLAVIITIMVLELHIPHGTGLGSLAPFLPTFLVYVLSFVYVGIYWNNHHHLFKAVERIDGRAMWANLHLLFWLSLVPFVTGWLGENRFAAIPTAGYGVVLLMAGVAYDLLVLALVAGGRNPVLAEAVGSDFKGNLSIVCYLLAIGLAFVNRWLSDALFVLVALIWFVPDRRIERRLPR